MKTVRCSVDRIEGSIAVLISDNDEIYHLNARNYSLSVNDVVDITVDGTDIVSLVQKDAVSKERYENNKSRLSALFKKNKTN